MKSLSPDAQPSNSAAAGGGRHDADADPASTLTLMRVPAGDDRRLAKVISPQGVTKVKLPYIFEFSKHPIAGLESLRDQLLLLSKDVRTCVVRAQPLVTSGRRLLKADRKTGDAATLVEVPSTLLAVDVDSVPEPERVRFCDEPHKCALHVRSLLPPQFRTAACVWHVTGSAGIKPGIRMHLWFMTSAPVGGAALTKWFEGTPIDPAVFRPSQPIFTADPVFDGVSDPMTERLGTLEGIERVLVPDEIANYAKPKRAPARPYAEDPNKAEANAGWEAKHPVDWVVGPQRYPCGACGSSDSIALREDGRLNCHSSKHREVAPNIGTWTGEVYVGTRLEFTERLTARQVAPWLKREGYWPEVKLSAKFGAPRDHDSQGASALLSGITEIESRPHDEPGLAEMFAERYASQVVYVAGIGWHTYDGTRWVSGGKDAKPSGQVSAMLRALAKMHDDAGRAPLAKKVAGMQSRRSLDNIAALAAQGPLRISPEQLDAHPYLLNCTNGTLDLRTGALSKHDPKDLITLATDAPYDPQAECGAWEFLLGEYSCAPGEPADPTWIEYIQQQLGSALFGTPQREYIVFWEGSGGNGKSTVMNTVARVLGKYAGALPASAVTDSNAHTSSIGGLVGKRFVHSAEIDAKRPIAAARLKALVGYEGMRVQPGMGQNYVDYVPSGKLTLSINGAPRITDADRAMRRRLRIVPFRAELPSDPELVRVDLELVAEERAGILAWLVRGAQKSLSHKGVLPDCSAVDRATDDAFAVNDPIADWIEACCERSPDAKSGSGELYRSYKGWAVAEHELHPLGRKQFFAALAERGFQTAKGGNGARLRRGLRIVAGPGRVNAVALGGAEVASKIASRHQQEI